MDNFPPELLDLIASFLPTANIPDFRLSSRVFADVGNRYLRLGKYFYFRKRSLERLCNIAQHPILHRNLEEITFRIDIVPHFKHQSAWEYKTYYTVYQGGRCPPLPSELSRCTRDNNTCVRLMKGEFRRIGWELHQKVRHEQEELLKFEDTFKILRDNLAMLHNLRAFSITTFSCNWNRLEIRIPTLEAYRDCYFLNMESDLDSVQRVPKQLTHAVLTSKTINCKPCLRRLDITGADFANRHGLIFDISLYLPTLKQIHTIVFRNMNSILNGVLFKFSEDRTVHYFQELLMNADNLQSFYMSGHNEPPHFLEFIPPKNHKWSRLSKLDLHRIYINVPAFKEFLSLHAGCLKVLRLYHAILGFQVGQVPYRWIQLMIFMASNLGLSDLRLGGFLEEDYDIYFNSRAKYRLGSGTTITVRDIAQFLVCGRYPADVKPADRECFTELTWDHLLAGYQ